MLDLLKSIVSSLIDQKEDIQHVFPRTKSIISYVCRLNRPLLQSTDRSLADGEFTCCCNPMPMAVSSYFRFKIQSAFAMAKAGQVLDVSRHGGIRRSSVS
jgi:hypothetical protein